MIFIAENLEAKKVVGYVMGKVAEDSNTTGHVTSLAVHRSYWKLGIA